MLVASLVVALPVVSGVVPAAGAEDVNNDGADAITGNNSGSTSGSAYVVYGGSAPVAADDSYNTAEDTTLVVAAPGVLVDDTDADNDALTAAMADDPTHGTVLLDADGSFTYTPDGDYSGSDSFTYRAADATTNSNVATVTLTIDGVNDAPVAVDDAYATDEDTPLTVAAPGVLGNDTDTEGHALTAELDSGPAYGSLTLNADGSFTYIPNSNFQGTDSFTYRAVDANDTSAPATVDLMVIGVNDAPVAVDDSFSTAEDTPLTVAAPGVLGNDADPESHALIAELVNGPVNGTLVLNPDGSFTYTPDDDFHGPDSFTYRAADPASSNVATVFLTVDGVNDAPVAVDDSYTAAEDTALIVAAPGVSGNDTDTENHALTAELDSGPAHGTLTLNADGSFTYTADLDFHGTDSFTYRAADASAISSPATVSLSVIATPTITNITPSSGPVAGGTEVVITGAGFTGATAVRFGVSNPAAFEFVSDTEITATSPRVFTTGDRNIRVNTPGGISPIVAADVFTYTLAAPTITGVAPSSGPMTGGTVVTITGTDFTPATRVRFGKAGPATTFDFVSPTEIRATSPASAVPTTRDILVTTAGGESPRVAADRFTWLPPVPVITGIDPSSGPLEGKTEVTITGTDLWWVTRVRFGNAGPAATFTIDSPTQITATSPASAVPTRRHIRVTSAGGESAAVVADLFTWQ